MLTGCGGEGSEKVHRSEGRERNGKLSNLGAWEGVRVGWEDPQGQDSRALRNEIHRPTQNDVQALF